MAWKQLSQSHSHGYTSVFGAVAEIDPGGVHDGRTTLVDSTVVSDSGSGIVVDTCAPVRFVHRRRVDRDRHCSRRSSRSVSTRSIAGEGPVDRTVAIWNSAKPRVAGVSRRRSQMPM